MKSGKGIYYILYDFVSSYTHTLFDHVMSKIPVGCNIQLIKNEFNFEEF